MYPVHRRLCIDGGDFTTPAAIALAVLVLILSGPAAALAQTAPGPPTAAAQPDGADPEADPEPDEPLTFLDSVSVSATLRPAPVRDTPGMVSVIDDETIQERMIEDFADLVKYEPGVYVENNVTRLGLNGFNIRGIGGNRVMMMVDGVQTSEQFDFGPFNIHQAGLDVDTLKTVEIVRSANSALYGSDALGGVVSLFTKDPADYLRQGQPFYVGAKTTWDGRADDVGVNLTLAGGSERVQASVFGSINRGSEIHNKGTVDARDHTRTLPNPQEMEGQQVLAKLVFNVSPGNRFRTTAELYDTRVETDWFSNNQLLDFGRFSYLINETSALDTQKRQRFSVDHNVAGRGLDLVSWQVYGQFNDTAQIVDEERMTLGFGPPFSSTRQGDVEYEQVGYGGSAQGQHWLGGPDDGMLVTFGASYKTDYFDMQRDRSEFNVATGQPVRTSLIFPTKYFPESDLVEAGAYLQGEIRFGRVTLVPGVRYDHFSLDANQADPVFIASLNPEPADFSDGALSPKVGMAARLSDVVTLHAQYSGGFRAPPYSAINTGFTNPRGGYTTLPNPDLGAETSENLEVGIRTAFDRASFGISGFSNRYDDFIDMTSLGFNRMTGLLEFQSRNLEEAEIKGVELRGEAYLSDSVMIRGSYARIDGVEIFKGAADDPPLAEETQLGSIAPDEAVIGLRYVQPRWGSELSLRLVEQYQQGGDEQDQFAPDAYRIVDLVNFVSLTETLRFRFGLLNLADAKYFEWWNVRGLPANDPFIDRYSSPGRSVITSLAYDW